MFCSVVPLYFSPWLLLQTLISVHFFSNICFATFFVFIFLFTLNIRKLAVINCFFCLFNHDFFSFRFVKNTLIFNPRTFLCLSIFLRYPSRVIYVFGWFGSLLSWKSCFEMKFASMSVVLGAREREIAANWLSVCCWWWMIKKNQLIYDSLLACLIIIAFWYSYDDNLDWLCFAFFVWMKSSLFLFVGWRGSCSLVCWGEGD